MVQRGSVRNTATLHEIGTGDSSTRNYRLFETTRAPRDQFASRRMLYCLSSSRHVVPVVVVIQSSVGEWLSLVEHLVRDQGVGGSNPLSPTKFFQIN